MIDLGLSLSVIVGVAIATLIQQITIYLFVKLKDRAEHHIKRLRRKK